MPHLDAAYNLARWLTGDPTTRGCRPGIEPAALRFIDSFRGGDPRSWLLRIVRNTAYHVSAKGAPNQSFTGDRGCHSSNPETIALRNIDVDTIREELARLPRFSRDPVLREMEGLAYKRSPKSWISDWNGDVAARSARKELRARLTGRWGWMRSVMNCDEVETLLHGYMDGELDAVTNQSIELTCRPVRAAARACELPQLHTGCARRPSTTARPQHSQLGSVSKPDACPT